MRKRIVSILCAMVAIVFATAFGSGCGNDDEAESEPHWPEYNPYHVAHIHSPLKKSFIFAKENRIAAYYTKNGYYDPLDPEGQEFISFRDPNKDYTNEELQEFLNVPSSRIILLTEQAQLEEAFEEPPDIDLETQMVAIVLFGSFHKGESLYNVKIENGILEVVIGMTYEGVWTAPTFSSRALQLDKAEISDAWITEKEIR